MCLDAIDSRVMITCVHARSLCAQVSGQASHMREHKKMVVRTAIGQEVRHEKKKRAHIKSNVTMTNAYMHQHIVIIERLRAHCVIILFCFTSLA